MRPLRLLRLCALLPLLGSLTPFCSAKETWVEVKSPHFVAYSDDGEAEARRALTAFEGLRSVFGVIFPGIRLDPPKPMLIIVTRDQDSMARFLPGAFEGKDPKRPAGMFTMGADRNYAILRTDARSQVEQPYAALFHEYTHSVVHQNFPSLPTWLDEGIADYYGATEIRTDKVYLGRIPRGRLQELRDRIRLPMETLLTVTPDSPHYREGEKAGIFYAQSWAFVHYLFMDEGACKAGLFSAYLGALAKEKEPLAAAKVAFGDLGKLQGTLGMYSHQTIYRFAILPLVVGMADKEFQARPLSAAEALLVRAEFLHYTQHEAEAWPLLKQALALEPKNPAVHAALGHGHVMRGEVEGAQQEFEEAIRLGSQDFRPPYYLAKLAQEGSGEGRAGRVQRLAWLEAARTLRPDFPGTHLVSCREYSHEPADPERAIQEGKAAVQVEPQNLAYRAELGLAFIRLDREAPARAIGAQLKAMAATPWEKQVAEFYEGSLAHYLTRKAQAATPPPGVVAAAPGPEPAQPPGVSGQPPQALKFSLSSAYAPLGQEVLRLVQAGRTEVAVQKVQHALAKATNDYDRKSLGALLVALKAPSPGQR